MAWTEREEGATRGDGGFSRGQEETQRAVRKSSGKEGIGIGDLWEHSAFCCSGSDSVQQRCFH